MGTNKVKLSQDYDKWQAEVNTVMSNQVLHNAGTPWLADELYQAGLCSMMSGSLMS
jgi:hypothetical protein